MFGRLERIGQRIAGLALLTLGMLAIGGAIGIALSSETIHNPSTIFEAIRQQPLSLPKFSPDEPRFGLGIFGFLFVTIGLIALRMKRI